jgi:hypothetical protein
MQMPTLGREVYFRSRTGNYTLSAQIIGTQDSVAPAGITKGHVRRLSSPLHVHLLVRSPAFEGPARGTAADFINTDGEHPIEEPVNGIYREWDVGPAGILTQFGTLGAGAEYDRLEDGWEVVSRPGSFDPSEAFAARTWAWPVRV